jgi:hypothetical protein
MWYLLVRLAIFANVQKMLSELLRERLVSDVLMGVVLLMTIGQHSVAHQGCLRSGSKRLPPSLEGVGAGEFHGEMRRDRIGKASARFLNQGARGRHAQHLTKQARGG